MLYLLPVLSLLFVVSFGDKYCNSIIYTDSTHGNVNVIDIPTDQCMISESLSSKYECDPSGTQINLNIYNSANCSGDNIYKTFYDICKLDSFNYTDCKAICGKSNCNRISVTKYPTNDCSGYIKEEFNLIPGICYGDNSPIALKFFCSNGQIQVNIYNELSDCLNTTKSYESIKYDPSTCVEIEGENIIFEGCESSTISTTTPMSTKSSP